MKVNKLKKLFLLIIILIIEEILFSVILTGSIGNLILKIILIIITSLGIDFFTNLFPVKINKIIYIVNIIFISVLHIIYLIYNKIFENFLTIKSIITGIKEVWRFSRKYMPRDIKQLGYDINLYIYRYYYYYNIKSYGFF